MHGATDYNNRCSFMIGYIVQLHGAVSYSANFSGMTLSSIYGKIFDKIVLSRFSDRLSSSELLFGSR